MSVFPLSLGTTHLVADAEARSRGRIRPILLASASVNQRLPSGPAVIPAGTLSAVGIGNSVIVPLGVIRPILLPLSAVNQRLPSGPAVIPTGLLGPP